MESSCITCQHLMQVIIPKTLNVMVYESPISLLNFRVLYKPTAKHIFKGVQGKEFI